MQIKNILENNNVNVNKTNLNNVKRYNVTGIEVHRIASTIADKLQDYNSINYFYKAAWQIPEYKLMNFLEQAQKGQYPSRYFTWLCTQELQRLNKL